MIIQQYIKNSIFKQARNQICENLFNPIVINFRGKLKCHLHGRLWIDISNEVDANIGQIPRQIIEQNRNEL